MFLRNSFIFAAAWLAALLAAPVQAETVTWYDAAYRQCADAAHHLIIDGDPRWYLSRVAKIQYGTHDGRVHGSPYSDRCEES